MENCFINSFITSMKQSHPSSLPGICAQRNQINHEIRISFGIFFTAFFCYPA